MPTNELQPTAGVPPKGADWRPARWLWLLMAAAALCLVIVHLIQGQIIMPSFLRLERQSAEKNLARCVDAISRETYHLELLCGDWSAWDDTYQFAKDQNQQFLSKNIDWPTLEANSGVNLIMFYSLDGQRIWGEAYAERDGGKITLDEFGPILSSANRSLISFADASSRQKGLLITSHGPLLLCAQPILRTDGKGPFSAALLMGRFLSNETLETLAKQIQVDFKVSVLQQVTIPFDREQTLQRLASQPYVFDALSDEMLQGYALVRDLWGKPALLVSATFPRDVMKQGLATARLAAWSTEATLALAVLLLVLWNKQRLDESRRYAARIEQLVSERTSQLREAQVFLETALAQSPSGIVIADAPNVSVRLANPAAFGLFGGSRSLLVGSEAAQHVARWNRFLPDGSPCAHGQLPLVRAVRRGEVVRGEELLVRDESGNESWVSVNAAPIRDASGTIRAGIEVLNDITLSKHAEEAFNTAQRLASIGTLAGGIAHDFNNILMAIYGNIELAQEDIPLSHPARATLDEAEHSMNRAVRLTQQLLTFSRGGDPVKEDVSIGQLAEEVARFDLSGSSVSLQISHPPDLWRVEADKGQLQQVISNLVINARESMPDGGRVSIALSNLVVDTTSAQHLPPGRYVQIVVRDNGGGIDPKILGRIFEPYFTTKSGGNGLGLATTYSIIARHGGVISVESDLGKGTAFTVLVPASSSQTEVTHAPERAEACVPSARSERVLVLDDEEPVRNLIAAMLKKGGFDVDTVAEGAEAVSRYQAALAVGKRYDALIMDLTIPGGLGGKEALRQILAVDPAAKAIASSGYAADPVIAHGSDYGFKATLAKPYAIRTLLSTLKRVLADESAPHA